MLGKCPSNPKPPFEVHQCIDLCLWTQRSDAIATFRASWARDGHFACQWKIAHENMLQLRPGFEGLGHGGSAKRGPVETLGTYGYSLEHLE